MERPFSVGNSFSCSFLILTTGSLDPDRRMPVPLWMFRVLLLDSQTQEGLGSNINSLAIVGQSCLVAQS